MDISLTLWLAPLQVLYWELHQWNCASAYLIYFLFICFPLKCRTGNGRISACGGNGFGGGGGGRVSVDVFSRHDDPKIFVHGKAILKIFHCLMGNFVTFKFALFNKAF